MYLSLQKGNFDNIPDSYKWVFGETSSAPGSTIVSEMFESLDVPGSGCPNSSTNWYYNKGTVNNVEWVKDMLEIFCVSTAQKEGMSFFLTCSSICLPALKIPSLSVFSNISF